MWEMAFAHMLIMELKTIKAFVFVFIKQMKTFIITLPFTGIIKTK